MRVSQLAAAGGGGPLHSRPGSANLCSRPHRTRHSASQEAERPTFKAAVWSTTTPHLSSGTPPTYLRPSQLIRKDGMHQMPQSLRLTPSRLTPRAVCPLQLPVPPPRPPAPHLHERIRPQLHAGHYGQEQERVRPRRRHIAFTGAQRTKADWEPASWAYSGNARG